MEYKLNAEDVLRYGNPERAIIVSFVETKADKSDFCVDKSKKSFAPIAIAEFKKLLPWVHENTIKRHLSYLVKNKHLVRKSPAKKLRPRISAETGHVNGLLPRLYRAV